MNPDFLSTYYPALKELSDETVLSARDRLDLFIRSKFPELDTRVNSVFGDLMLTPYAYMLASHEEAMGRFMSDLDLENVAAGNVWNCDFVRKYLDNFAVVDRDNLQSTGVIRLTFCVNQDYTIDRRTRYSFGDGIEFTLRLPHPGHLELKSAGGLHPVNQNVKSLVQIDSEKWAVDVGVVGVMGDNTVTKGDSATTDLIVDDLEMIVASVDFTSGIEEDGLSNLAERTRKTFYASTLATRTGAYNFLSKEFPELDSASPVISGDDEQVRSVNSILGIPDGRSDIYVKSHGFATVDSQIVTLLYDPTDTKYKAKLDLLNPPCFIDSIVSASSLSTDLGFGSGGTEILSQTKDVAKAPFLSASYSKYEQLYLAIDEPSTPLTNTVVDGEQYHDFKITYRSDPSLNVVTDVVNADDNKPVGVDVLTRGFVVIRITDIEIEYVKKSGTKMALDTARSEIYNYFKKLGYDCVYTDAKIFDAMYYAGAQDIKSINPTGFIQWSVADQAIPNDSDDPIDDWASVSATGRSGPVSTITTTSDFVPDIQDPNLGTPATETFVSAGKRNVCYLLDSADIKFTEVLP